MLCSKCGYISFDHLAVCAKCHADLSLVSAGLQGTAVDVSGGSFLGSLLSAGAAVADPGAAEAEGGDLLIGAEDVPSADEHVSPVVTEESPALDFDLSEPDQVVVLEESLEPELPLEQQTISLPEAEPEAPELALPEEAALPEEEAPVAAALASGSEMPGEGLDFDAASLLLDSLEDEGQAAATEVSAPAGEGSESGQLSIDLEAIDMSDLMAPGKASAQPVSEEGGELAFDETMDLSLYADAGPSLEATADEDLAPVDLTIADDALRDLTVDSGHKEGAAKAKPVSEIPELTMED